MSKVMSTYANMGLGKRRSRSYCFTNEDMRKRPTIATPFAESNADRDQGDTIFGGCSECLDVYGRYDAMASIAKMLKSIGIRFRIKTSAAIPLVDTKRCVLFNEIPW